VASAAPTPATSASAAPTEAYDDPAEAHDPATLPPLFGKADRPAFPKGTVDEATCWKKTNLVGNAVKDFATLVDACGAASGFVEYVKPAEGKLHSVHDKRDNYLVKIQGGLCYRFFGVADGTIKDLDILIEKPGGILVGDDQATGTVALIRPDGAWCLDSDSDYEFRVEVDGEGTGHYVFGVWARPKTKADKPR
jgi:hypothetical protein